MKGRVQEHPLTGYFTSTAIIDYAPKDDPEMMQRPFFALSKRKRNKAIEYASPDCTVWVRVEARAGRAACLSSTRRRAARRR